MKKMKTDTGARRMGRRGVLSRFTEEEMDSMRDALGVQDAGLPDATVVGMFVRKNLRGGRRSRG